MNGIPIVGYSDRLSGVAGDTIAFKVSSQATGPFDAKLVRVIHADPNPCGPGLRIEDRSAVFAARCPSIDKPIHRGSYARVAGVPWPRPATDWSIEARVLPTRPAREMQCVLSQWDATVHCGWQLLIGEGGATALVADGLGRTTTVRCPAQVGTRWTDLRLRFIAASATLELTVASLDGRHPPRVATTTGSIASWSAPASDVLIGALGTTPVSRHFNGKIESPRIASDGAAIVSWDFARGIDSPDVFDTCPGAYHGTLVNLPTRAVRSSNWTGREICWRAAPGEYAAIHFHDDDLHDAGWSTDFTFSIPEGLASGSYAMEVSTEGARDWLPFWVSARPGRPTAPVVFVVPTYTYQAYANFARGNFDAALKQRVADWGAYPHNPDAHPEVGLSTYNLHGDGSGVAFSSRWRPMLTMRPGFVTFDDARGSGCRHYIADHHLLDWMEHEGIAFDVVTDDDLERHGSAILAPYRAVLTGTHPEYQSINTLDALEGYLHQGGNLAYLGGNGFYWRIGLSGRFPGALEMRRGSNGTRAWAAAPGEIFNAFDGAQGGLWRDSGRTPQQLVGIGFSSQGPFEGSTFRVHDDARSMPGGWLLDGVSSGSIGGYGLSGGGAAGFELDSTSMIDGSPTTYTLLATSEGHSAAFGPAGDAILSHTMSRDRRDIASLIKAEMIFYDTGWGGSVFSVGSITWCGALSHDRYRNDVSTVMRNYLRGVCAVAPSSNR